MSDHSRPISRESEEVDAVPGTDTQVLILGMVRDIQRSLRDLTGRFDDTFKEQGKSLAAHDREIAKIETLTKTSADHETRIRANEVSLTQSNVKMGLIGAVAGMAGAALVSCLVGGLYFVVTHSATPAPAAQVSH